jgi:putative SOS response-associated peptidase YedK
VSIVCRSSADEEIADPFGVWSGRHLHQREGRNSSAGTVFAAGIVTTVLSDLTRTDHNRMPVILARGDESGWLDPSHDPAKLLEMLRQYSAEEMEAVQVNPALNKPSFEGPACLEPPPAAA